MTINNTSQHGQDYLTSSVPSQARRNSFAVLMVWMGFIIVVGIMTVGGGLASKMSLRDLIFAVIIGNLFLAGFAALAGITGASSGRSFNLLLQDAFPEQSAKIASLYVPIVLIGWYAIESSIFGHLVASAIGLGGISEKLLIVGSAFLFALSAYIGFKLVVYTAYVWVPVIVIIGLWAITAAAKPEGAHFGFGEGSLSLSTGIAIVVGTWIMGALTCMQDMTRFTRSAWSGAWVASIGILLANSFTILIGAAGAALTQESDPARILLALGFIWPAIIFSIANIWTTNDSNMYSASIHVANLFHITRRKAVLLCTLLGAGFAVFEPYKFGFLFDWLIFLGKTAPALGAVVLASYWLVPNGKRTSRASVAAWIGWIGGSFIGTLLGGDWAFLVGFISGGVLYIAFMKIFGYKLQFQRGLAVAATETPSRTR